MQFRMLSKESSQEAEKAAPAVGGGGRPRSESRVTPLRKLYSSLPRGAVSFLYPLYESPVFFSEW